MGYRTIVILNDDSDWINDPHLGKRIAEAERTRSGYFYGESQGYVRASESSSIDELIHVRHLSMTCVGQVRYTGVEEEDTHKDRLSLVKEVADDLGYRLVKKNVKKKG